jgi:UDP-3-O-[3-hydroxymyristoyl] glucosamine N-acyltransferase
MKLSHFFEKTLRDGRFELLGYLSSGITGGLLSYLSDKKLLSEYDLNKEKISCIVTTKEIANALVKSDSIVGVAISDDPTLSFYELHNELASGRKYPSMKSRKSVVRSNNISKSAYVSPVDVTIGRDVRIDPRVVILPGVTIGDGSVIRAGAVIGSEGFENKRTRSGVIHVEHAGKVEIGKNVDVGANTCICKGLFPYDITTIGQNTKIDQLVHVAHNVQIGRNCMIVASSLLGGSTVLEDNCWIGPSAVVTNNVRIGKNAFVTLGSVVTRNVPSGRKVSGVWAIDHEKFLRLMKSNDRSVSSRRLNSSEMKIGSRDQ